MTLSGFKKATQDINKVDRITQTSVQMTFPSNFKEGTFKINDEDETFEYVDKNGFKYIHDINDVNLVIINSEGKIVDDTIPL